MKGIVLLILCLSSLVLIAQRPINPEEDVWRIRQYNEVLSMHLTNALISYNGLMAVGTQDAVDLIAPSTYKRLGSYHYKSITGAALNAFRGERVFLCAMEEKECIIVADESGYGLINVCTGEPTLIDDFENEEVCKGIYKINSLEFIIVSNKRITQYRLARKSKKSKGLDTYVAQKPFPITKSEILCTNPISNTSNPGFWAVTKDSVFKVYFRSLTSPKFYSALDVGKFQKNKRSVICSYLGGFAFANGNQLLISAENKLTPCIEEGSKVVDPTLEILDIAAFGKNQLFIATDKGLYIYDGKSIQRFHITDRNQKSVDQFTTLMTTSDYVMCIGTRSAGVLTINPAQSITIRAHFPYPDDQHYVKNYARSMVYSVQKDLIFLGTDDSQVILFDLKNSKLLDTINLPYTEIKALADDLKGNLYAGTRQGKVYKIRYNLNGNSLEDRPSDSLMCTDEASIASLYFDQEKKELWVGSVNGLYSFKPPSNNRKWLQKKLEKDPIKGSKKIDIRFISILQKRLVCATAMGLYYFNSKDSTLVPFISNSLNIHITHFKKMPGSASIYFAGTRSDGLYKLRIQGDSVQILHHYTAKRNGLSVNGETPIYLIYSCQFDNNRRLWVSTNQGLFRLDDCQRNDALFTWFSYRDLGLNKPAEFNTGSFTQRGDSTLLFGSRDGFVEIRSYPKKQLKIEKNLNRLQFWKENTDVDSSAVGLILLKTDKKNREKLKPGFDVYRIFVINPGFNMEGQPGALIKNIYLKPRYKADSFYALSSGKPFEIHESKTPDRYFFSKQFEVKATTNISFFFTRTIPGYEWGMLVLMSVIWFFFDKSKKKKKRIEVQKKALELIHTFSTSLREINDYEDIQSIFDDHNFKNLLRDGLKSDQIAVNIYREKLERLEMVAFALPDPKAIAPKKQYYLVPSTPKAIENLSPLEQAEYREDKNRPIAKIWEWIQAGKDEVIEVNDAIKFYKDNHLTRVKPLLGQKSDSFIFMPIYIGKEKDKKIIGVITIQNETGNAYTEVKSGEPNKTWTFEETGYLETIRDNIALSLNKIYTSKNKLISESEHKFIRKTHSRLTDHFFGNYMNTIKFESIVEADEDRVTILIDTFNHFISTFIKHASHTHINLRDEVEFVNSYVNEFIKESRETNSTSYVFKFDNSVFTSLDYPALEIPTFLLLNVVNNTIEHNYTNKPMNDHQIDIDMKVEYLASSQILSITIKDNGTGIGDKKNAVRIGDKTGFLTRIKEYFEQLNQHHGLLMLPEDEQFRIEHGHIIDGPGYWTKLIINTKVFQHEGE